MVYADSSQGIALHPNLILNKSTGKPSTVIREKKQFRPSWVQLLKPMLQKPQSLWEWGNIQVMGLKGSKRHLYTYLFSRVWDLNTTFRKISQDITTHSCQLTKNHAVWTSWPCLKDWLYLRKPEHWTVKALSAAIQAWIWQAKCCFSLSSYSTMNIWGQMFWTWSCWIRLRAAPSTKTVCKRFPLAPTAPRAH